MRVAARSDERAYPNRQWQLPRWTLSQPGSGGAGTCTWREGSLCGELQSRQNCANATVHCSCSRIRAKIGRSSNSSNFSWLALLLKGLLQQNWPICGNVRQRLVIFSTGSGGIGRERGLWPDVLVGGASGPMFSWEGPPARCSRGRGLRPRFVGRASGPDIAARRLSHRGPLPATPLLRPRSSTHCPICVQALIT